MSKLFHRSGEGIVAMFLKELADEVEILGLADNLDSLGFNQIIRVNGGEVQRVDGTSAETKDVVRPLYLKYRLVIAVEALSQKEVEAEEKTVHDWSDYDSINDGIVGSDESQDDSNPRE